MHVGKHVWVLPFNVKANLSITHLGIQKTVTTLLDVMLCTAEISVEIFP